jgi:hypothetical protein
MIPNRYIMMVSSNYEKLSVLKKLQVIKCNRYNVWEALYNDFT